MQSRGPRRPSGDVACWVLKTHPPAGGDRRRAGRPGTAVTLTRCVRRSYRLDLMAAGQPCLLWLSGRDRPGVHALGAARRARPRTGTTRPAVPVRLTLLAEPVPRADLLGRPPDAATPRCCACRPGSNPSWLSAAQFAAVLDRVPERTGLGRWDAVTAEPTPLGRARLAADPAVLRRGDGRAGPRCDGAYSRADDVISDLGASDSAGAPADERLVRRAGGAHPGRRPAAAAGAAARRRAGRRRSCSALAAVGVLLVGVFPSDGNCAAARDRRRRCTWSAARSD